MRDDRDVEVTHEIPGFVAELRRLADALEAGQAFAIDVGGETVTLPEGATFSVAHEREGGKVELEFQVTWAEEGAGDDDEAEEGELAEDTAGETAPPMIEAEGMSQSDPDAVAEQAAPVAGSSDDAIAVEPTPEAAPADQVADLAEDHPTRA